MKSTCGTCWIQAFLHACLCVHTLLIPMITECKCTKKAHSPNCKLVCRKKSITSWLKRQMNQLIVFGEVNYNWKCQACLFPIKEWGALKSTLFVPYPNSLNFCLSCNRRLWVRSHQSLIYEGGFCQCVSMEMERSLAIRGFLQKYIPFPIEKHWQNPPSKVESNFFRCDRTLFD